MGNQSLIIRAMALRRPGSHPNAGAFPPGMPGPALRALARVGVCSVDDAVRLSEEDIAGLRGMGPAALALLKSELARRGKTLATYERKKRVRQIPPGSERPRHCPWCGDAPRIPIVDLLPDRFGPHIVECRTCGRSCRVTDGRRAVAALLGSLASAVVVAITPRTVGYWPVLAAGATVLAVVSVGVLRLGLRLERHNR